MSLALAQVAGGRHGDGDENQEPAQGDAGQAEGDDDSGPDGVRLPVEAGDFDRGGVDASGEGPGEKAHDGGQVQQRGLL